MPKTKKFSISQIFELKRNSHNKKHTCAYNIKEKTLEHYTFWCMENSYMLV